MKNIVSNSSCISEPSRCEAEGLEGKNEVLVIKQVFARKAEAEHLDGEEIQDPSFPSPLFF